MRVILNLEQCQGHARCEDICPEIFATDEIEGKCVLRHEEIPEALLEKTRLAVKNCPEGALRLAKSKEA